ncbi:MAG: mechanosensitive ion channel family protein [Chloroflexi bacterium]|nr:mechanosensitive ion channel family protein [Chloroflexota bacterium]MDA8216097.1 mechanosensitive ion channel family protein [Dehalococcoidales bacterium]
MADLPNQQAVTALGIELLGQAFGLVVIVVLAAVACAFVRRLARRSVRLAVERVRSRQEPHVEELAKRYETLGMVALKAGIAIIWTIAGFMALSQLNIDIAPILASAGVVGVAVGFGAQTLVRDLIAGLFIILENQYGKGDVVKVADVSGLVEEVNLRRTVLRDLDGTVHHVPNGEVRVASNLTREWSRVNMNVSVAYGEDLDRVMAVIDRLGEELAADPVYGPFIVEAPKALRVDAFEDSGIAIKILGVTKPVKQWEIMGELRRRLKRAFDEEGIEFAFAQRLVYMRGEKEGARVSPPAGVAASSDRRE